MRPLSRPGQDLDVLCVEVERDLVAVVPFLIARLALLHTSQAARDAATVTPSGRKAPLPLAA